MDERALAERLITYDTSALEGMQSAVKGWLERRIRKDVQWRLTDEGLLTLRGNVIREAHTSLN